MIVRISESRSATGPIYRQPSSPKMAVRIKRAGIINNICLDIAESDAGRGYPTDWKNVPLIL